MRPGGQLHGASHHRPGWKCLPYETHGVLGSAGGSLITACAAPDQSLGAGGGITPVGFVWCLKRNERDRSLGGL